MSAGAWVLQAFPTSVRAEAGLVASALPHAPLDPAGRFEVVVAGEQVAIPYRIYQPELPASYESWTGSRRVVADCLYTRHHDGRIRERHARLIVADTSPWVIPFAVQLIGEYVLDIVLALEEGLTQLSEAGSAQRRAYGAFASANLNFVQVTRARVVSYWNCYYRRQFPSLDAYPPHRLLKAVQRAGEVASGTD